MNRIHNPLEKMNPEKMAVLQLERLQRQLSYVYSHSSFYQKKFLDAGIHPSDIKNLKDLENIPFTTKQELRDHNQDFFCVKNKDIVDIGASTGTTGRPVILPLTKKDWDDNIECVKRFFTGLGIHQEDIVQLSVAFDQLFSAATPLDYALKDMGATVARMGPGNPGRQLDIMKQLGTTMIFATPGFMLLLAEEAKELGLNLKQDLNLKKALLVGQSLYTQDFKPNELCRRIRDLWGVEIFSDYGSMEMFAGFVECKQHRGHHVYSDFFIMEIIDPETGQTLPPGELGELVFTHLTREATPFVRFRHGDITKLETAPCACGRTTPRIMATVGRVDQMLKIRGTSVYPEQIEEALLSVEGVSSYVIEAYTDGYGSDNIRLKVAFQGPAETIISNIQKTVKAKARIKPDQIERISSQEASRIWFSEGSRKPKKFWDKRNKPPH